MKSWYSIPALLLLLSAGTQCRSAGTDQVSPPHTAQQEPSDSDTLSKAFYPDGKLQQLVLKKDSGDYRQQVLTYYVNGGLKEKGYQGHYEGKDISTGTYAGTWSYYDSTGKLKETIYYHNDEQPKAYIEKTRYYASGKVKAIERFNNYELYESDIDSIGDWKYFDEKGKLIRTIHHKNRP